MIQSLLDWSKINTVIRTWNRKHYHIWAVFFTETFTLVNNLPELWALEFICLYMHSLTLKLFVSGDPVLVRLMRLLLPSDVCHPRVHGEAVERRLESRHGAISLGRHLSIQALTRHPVSHNVYTTYVGGSDDLFGGVSACSAVCACAPLFLPATYSMFLI